MFALKHIKNILIQNAPHISKGTGGHALTESEMYAWAFEGLILTLDVGNKIIKNLKIGLNRFEDFDQTYYNSSKIDKLRRFYFDVEYDQELWTGPEEGSIVVHQRIIEKAIMETITNDLISEETDRGELYVLKRIPGVIYRVGCICCYGSGPDLTISYETERNGNFVITYTVDFDFNIPEEDRC